MAAMSLAQYEVSTSGRPVFADRSTRPISEEGNVPMQITREQLDALYEMTVVSDDGHTLGPVGHIYLDDRTQHPLWVTARTGLFGFREVFAPFLGARIEPDTLKVRYTKDYIMDGPRIDSDGHITEQEQDELLRYFRLHRPTPQADAPPAEPGPGVPAAPSQEPLDDDLVDRG